MSDGNSTIRVCRGTALDSSAPNPSVCCRESAALFGECGVELYPLYSTKMPWPKWPGQKSPVEKAYVRAHRSEAASKAAKAAGERLAKVRFLPPEHTTQTAVSSKDVSNVTGADNVIFDVQTDARDEPVEVAP